MTEKQEIYRKSLLKKIHIHSKYKEIKRFEAWADWVYLRFECESSGELSIPNLIKVLDELYYPKTTRQLFSNLNSFPDLLPYETYKLQLPPLTTRFSSDSSPIFS